MRKQSLVLTLFFTSLFLTSFAHDEYRYRYIQYNRQSGMNEQTIEELAEDRFGFMWMMSQSSLQRFDGKSFHTIPFGYGSHQVPGSFFYSLHCTQDKKILVFHNNGISIYNDTTHTFTHRQNIIPSHDNQIHFLAELEKEMVVTNGSTIFYIDKKSFKETRPPVFWPGLDLVQKKMTPQTKGIYQYTGKGFRYYEFESGENRNIDITYLDLSRSLIYFHGNNIYFFQHDAVHIASRFDPDYKLKIFYPKQKKLNAFRIPENVHLLDSTNLLIVLDNEIWEFDTKKKNFSHPILSQSNQPFIQNGYFKSIYLDSKKNIWVNSNLDGVFKIISSSLPIQFIASETADNNFIKCLQVSRNTNRIIAGTYGNGILIFDTLGNLVKSFSQPIAEDESANIISSIGKINEDEYLVFIYNHQVQYKLNTRTFTMQKLNIHFQQDSIKMLRPNYYSELENIQPATFLYPAEKNMMRRLTVHDNDIYITRPSSTDLDRFKPNESRDVKYTDLNTLGYKDFFDKCLSNAGITGLLVQSLTPWHNSWLIATIRGLYKFDQQAKLLKKYELPNDQINAVIIDKKGDAWVTHNAGITRIDQKDQLVSLRKFDGLQDDEFNYGAAAMDENGKLYFGGIKGISSFYPDQISLLTQPPQLHIVDIKTSGNTLTRDSSFWEIEKLELPFKENQITISLAAMGDYRSSDYNYQYRIKELEDEWKDLKNQSEINLALSPGSYVVELAAGHTFDPKMKPIKTIEIIIHPPFYQTWWFNALIVLSVIGFFGWIMRTINQRKIKKHLGELKQKEQLEDERKRISRDLHDNMGAYTSALLSNVEKLKQQHGENPELTHIKQNAENILSSLRETIWVLNNKDITVEDFSDGFKNYCFKVLSNFDHIRFESEEDLQTSEKLSAPTAINLNHILKESVQNIIKHSGADCIHYTIRNKNGLVISITDNGIGYQEDAIKKGNGLENMEWRAKTAGADLSVVSVPGKGTRIIVRL